MTWSAPCFLTTSTFAGPPTVAITLASRIFPISIAAIPTVNDRGLEADGVRQRIAGDLLRDHGLCPRTPVDDRQGPISGPKSAHPVTDLGHDPGRFASRRERQGRPSLVTARHHQAGRKADPRRPDLQPNLARTGRGGRRNVLDRKVREVGELVDDDGAHKRISGADFETNRGTSPVPRGNTRTGRRFDHHGRDRYPRSRSDSMVSLPWSISPQRSPRSRRFRRGGWRVLRPSGGGSRGLPERRIDPPNEEEDPSRAVSRSRAELSQPRDVAPSPHHVHPRQLGASGALSAHSSDLRARSIRHGLLRGPQLHLGLLSGVA